MSSEKQLQFDGTMASDMPRSGPKTQRRNLKMALGGAALLATGMMAGLGATMYCGKTMGTDLRIIQQPASLPSQSSNGTLITNLFGRSPAAVNKQAGAVTIVNRAGQKVGQGDLVLSTKRPIKFYGPKLSQADAAAWKAANHAQSIEKREVAEEVEDIEARDIQISTSSAGVVHRVWQPTPGTTWTYQLNQPPTQAQIQSASQYQVWDIDLFDTPASTIQALQAAGSRVVCYFSGGTWENWRSDANQFLATDIGAPLGDWPGEYWINTNSANVRKIMSARLDLAKQKGCDGVDPDNMDAYNYANGFNLVQQDAINYVSYLSSQAQSRSLSISLKNSGDIISSVVNMVQYSVAEACYQYSECNLYTPFTKAGKPVFHVEYPKGYGVVNNNTVAQSSMTSICACRQQYKESPIVKNNDLGTWQQNC